MSVHIILKYKNPRLSGGVVDTIFEHLGILKKYGYVDFGVLGKGVSQERAGMLQLQKRQGQQTNLYLVSSFTDGLKTFRCSFDEITKEPKSELRHPAYYKELGSFTSWIRIQSMEEVDKSILSELVTISTDKLAVDSLTRGMASTLFVKEKNTRNS